PGRKDMVIARKGFHKPRSSVSRVPWIVGEKVDPLDSQSTDLLNRFSVEGTNASSDQPTRLQFTTSSNDLFAESFERRWSSSPKPPIQFADRPSRGVSVPAVFKLNLNTSSLCRIEQVSADVNRARITNDQ